MRGPTIPTVGELRERGFTRSVEASTPAELGGGFQAEMAVARALTDAFCGLFMFPSLSEKTKSSKKRKTEASGVEDATVKLGGTGGGGGAGGGDDGAVLNESSVMETSMMATHQVGDVSLMDVSVQSNSRMSIS